VTDAPVIDRTSWFPDRVNLAEFTFVPFSAGGKFGLYEIEALAGLGGTILNARLA